MKSDCKTYGIINKTKQNVISWFTSLPTLTADYDMHVYSIMFVEAFTAVQGSKTNM